MPAMILSTQIKTGFEEAMTARNWLTPVLYCGETVVLQVPRVTALFWASSSPAEQPSLAHFCFWTNFSWLMDTNLLQSINLPDY